MNKPVTCKVGEFTEIFSFKYMYYTVILHECTYMLKAKPSLEGFMVAGQHNLMDLNPRLFKSE